MTIHTHLRLVEGGLATKPLSRAQTVALMADDLIRLEAYGTEADAIRALMALQLYSSFEIMTMIDDARQVAATMDAVAKVMANT